MKTKYSILLNEKRFKITFNILLADVRPFFPSDSDDGIALCFRPDVMEPEELKEFPEFGR